jgi:hypothetical protein
MRNVERRQSKALIIAGAGVLMGLACIAAFLGLGSGETREKRGTIPGPPAPPEKAGKTRSPVVLGEIHYHPDPSTPGAEFIELWNVSTEPADLSGWSFTKGVEFTFPAGFRLEPDARAVICENVEGFRSAFGSKPAVAGTYTGKLDNAGERLQLGVRPILNGMDRIRRGQFKDRNDPAIFEVSLPVDPRKTLRAVVLLPQEATFKKPGGTRFNLLAATGIQVDKDD